MGVVYDAFDEQLQRPVALKQLRPRAGAGEASPPNGDPWLQPWLREARTLARLDHPNVVTLYEVVPHAGAHFLALERVDGVTLRVWLRARRRTTEEILDVFAGGGARAGGGPRRRHRPPRLQARQRAGRRDGRVRVADFGLAMPTTQREPVAAAGTPRYVAPEQARGEPPDARSDQYSFAVALLEAVSGATPAQGPTSGTQAVPLPLDDLPRGLWAVISRALAVRPGDRFFSLAALISALQGARRRRMARRRLALAAAVGSVLIGASAHGAWRAHVEAVATRQRLEAAHESAAHKTREAALLRAREAAMAEEAATLRSRQAEDAEEAEALRAQIASLAGDLTGGASAEARALRRTLRQRNNQVRALAQQLARQRDNPGQPVSAGLVRLETRTTAPSQRGRAEGAAAVPSAAGLPDGGGRPHPPAGRTGGQPADHRLRRHRPRRRHRNRGSDPPVLLGAGAGRLACSALPASGGANLHDLAVVAGAGSPHPLRAVTRSPAAGADR